MKTHLPGEIDKLAQEYPVLQETKLKKNLSRLDRMSNFYTEKAEVAPEKQSMLFGGFVSALEYAISISKRYDKLTKELTKLRSEVKE